MMFIIDFNKLNNTLIILFAQVVPGLGTSDASGIVDRPRHGPRVPGAEPIQGATTAGAGRSRGCPSSILPVDLDLLFFIPTPYYFSNEFTNHLLHA
jgi:hypothetical protein